MNEEERNESAEITISMKNLVKLVASVNSHWQNNKYPYTYPMVEKWLEVNNENENKLSFNHEELVNFIIEYVGFYHDHNEARGVTAERFVAFKKNERSKILQNK